MGREAFGRGVGDGIAFEWGGARRVYKVRASESEGRFSSSVFISPPRYPGPPVHRHLHTDEMFFVIRGDLLFRLGDDVIPVPEGGFAFVPAGLAHGFTNRGDTAAEVIEMFAPGDFEGYFDELAQLRAGQRATPDAIRAIQVKYGMEIVAAPLGATNSA